MARSRPFLALAAALVLAALPVRVEPAETPGTLKLSYHVWQGGFHALTLTAVTTGAMTGVPSDDPSDYRAQVWAETNGLVGWLFPYALQAHSEGQAKAAELTPRYFETRSDKGGKQKERAVTYREEGAPDVRHDPPRDDDDEDAIADALLTHTLDPLSAVITAIERFARRGRCAGRVPVFDGRRRYDLVIKSLGPATVAPSSYGSYSGPATLCRVAVKPLAGFKRRRGSGSRMLIKVDVWLAPVLEEGPALPVRIEGENGLGHVVIHLVAADSSAPAKSASR